ncbi:hypothetical protein SAMN02745127_02080 [Oceanospirillum multiglobuliferum]|uniref:ArsR family transcriptional regulator n=1 Tax=Oceanospirillum multiglobuliferum TaxID=64969 RepID=A0A1T4QY75_9GAMM|nr:hypothetical protein [Oceanospirillum multiglobuliferum]OPX57060.1 hypothetical protein BTE48_01115 [Oceanospirillum multiglobuliferum]SKA08742.1 hypothetical protein SAMN02745127_02080 [Oceanospirillum multiglobuliferum]
MAIQKLLAEDQRLCLLRSLNDCGGTANESVVQDCLDAYGHAISRDAVRTHLAWLEEQGVLSLEDLAGCQIATLTERGYDVVEGRCTVPGIKRSRRS